MSAYLKCMPARISNVEMVIDIIDSYATDFFDFRLRTDEQGALNLVIEGGEYYPRAVKWETIPDNDLHDDRWMDFMDRIFEDHGEEGLMNMLTELAPHLETPLRVVFVSLDSDCDVVAQDWLMDPLTSKINTTKIRGADYPPPSTNPFPPSCWRDPHKENSTISIYAFSHLEYVQPFGPGVKGMVSCPEAASLAIFVHHPPDQPDLREGCYRLTSATTVQTIDRVPYHNYNWWLYQLSLFALGVSCDDVREDPEMFSGKSFVELICLLWQGIGPAMCAKLARDFTEHEEEARTFATERYVPSPYFDDPAKARVACKACFADQGQQWFNHYQMLKKAFELGAENGVVVFELRT
jgi:hypothetical protein